MFSRRAHPRLCSLLLALPMAVPLAAAGDRGDAPGHDRSDAVKHGLTSGQRRAIAALRIAQTPIDPADLER